MPRLALAVFRYSRTTALIWLLITAFGILSYTTLLRREGFPSVAIPIVVVNGSYAVNDAAQVDAKVAQPFSDIAKRQPNLTSIQATSDANFFKATLQYKESVDAKQASKQLADAVQASGLLPKGVHLAYAAPYFGVTGGSKDKIDATISVYATQGAASTPQLYAQAQAVTDYLNRQHLSQVDKFFVQSPYETIVNPQTGAQTTVQRTFDAYGNRIGDQTSFYNSVIIGVASVPQADAVKLNKQLQRSLDGLASQPQFKNVGTAISASYAPSIKQSISELQRVLLEGLLAVFVVGSIVIAVRTSIITVLSMVTVLAATVGLLYLVHYSLNVITLFGLILGLSLIVDDTIIMVEAIDASRRHVKTAREAVTEATRKISRAMVAATLTAALSFAPLLFVSGILGSFIREVPVTIISGLLISLVVALIFIPLFAKYILLGGKQLRDVHPIEIAASFEQRLARAIARPMLWARGSRRREVGLGLAAIAIGLGFVLGAAVMFKHVPFNIFPPTKDSNQLVVNMTFPPGTTITQAQDIANNADAQVIAELGPNFVDASNYGVGTAQQAALHIDITPYQHRRVTAPELVARLNKRFETFTDAKLAAAQVDVGPPAAVFTVTVNATNRPNALRAAEDVRSYLAGVTLTRSSGSQAHLKDVRLNDPTTYYRSDGTAIIAVTGSFDGADTTALTQLAKTAVLEKYTATELAKYGLPKDSIGFNLGQEQENQNSFQSLALAFPIVLAVIYVLLALQFRSFLQPLLIFMAIPFSLFGITSGLLLTNNSFSFFAMLGFFALIGLSIKNTILLTDYANQARRAGLAPVDAAVAALGERFRPLVATSITAVVSLIPLAVTSPFWQGLAVVLIFGLLSSTLLVVTIFPYFYLGAEYLRMRFTRPPRATARLR